MLDIADGHRFGGKAHANGVGPIVKFVPLLNLAAFASTPHHVEVSKKQSEQQERHQQPTHPWQN